MNKRTDIAAPAFDAIRMDVQEAVAGAFSALNSGNVVIRSLAANGSMDARFMSAPVILGAL